jgi:antitoxin FitA
MNSIQAVEVSTARSNVVHMSKMIQVRNVPDELHRALKASAAAEGMSLSDYIKRELGGLSTKASLDEIDARIRARGPSNLETDWVVQVIRESRGE